MTVEQHNVIDFVAHDPVGDFVLLVMVEAREWGHDGELLPDLQRKLDTYIRYVTGGRLVADHPEVARMRVRIELRACLAPGERELAFLRTTVARDLDPAGISFGWKRIGDAAAASSPCA